MSSANFLIPIVVILLMGFIFYRVFGGVFKQMQNRKRLAREGSLALADVISISQTGVTINQVPQMRLVLDVHSAGIKPVRTEIKQLIDLGAIPRAGDKVYVLVDPKNPGNMVLANMPVGKDAQVAVTDTAGNAVGTADINSNQVKDFMSLPSALRERGLPGVAVVVSAVKNGDGAACLVLDLDHIGRPAKRVTLTQAIDGFLPSLGTRLYYLYDPQNPDVLALMPPSMTGGQTLGAGANRLDPLVLGPQLLKEGAKANGQVLSAKPTAMANPLLAAQGYSKWELQLTVTPEDRQVSPYQAQLTISLTSKEKADRIAHSGAEVPLRYDPLDLQTISIDSIAMGYPDPYEIVLKTFSQQLNKG